MNVLAGEFKVYQAETIPEIIKEYLEMTSCSVRDLYLLVKESNSRVSLSNVKKWMSGEKIPSVSNRHILSRILQVPYLKLWLAVHDTGD